jgi:type II secretory pathway pseudopilin PulG
MKTRFNRRNPQRGSALLAVMIVIVILSFAAAGVLSYSLTSYRNSVRQAVLDQAKEVADSEMQYLYFSWKQNLITKQATPGIGVDTWMQNHPTTSNVAPTGQRGSWTAPGYDITVNLAPFASIAQGNWSGGTWTISRTLQFNNKYVPGATSTDGSAVGILNQTGGVVGKIYYYTAKTRATFSSPIFGTVEFHSGRNFQFSSASLFQYALFYQGNLELAAGGNLTIGGPVSTNSSAFVGASAGTLTLTNNVYYFSDYNGSTTPTGGEDGRYEASYTQDVENNQGQPASLADPVFNPNPLAAPPTDQTAQRQQQVIQLNQQQSFVGGVDVASALANYPNAYINPTTGMVADANEVYRAVIAPPPGVPEDPAVAASRLYNSAGIIITINQSTSGTEVQIGTAATPNAYYDTASPSSGVISQAQYTNIIPNVRQSIINKRELANGTPSVNLTTVDVAALNDALNTLMPGNTVNGTIPTYNGMVYVYDNTNNNALSTSIPTLANTQNAILIKDGAVTPNFTDSNGNPLGFTVASNNGVYIQGDYNIRQIDVNGTATTNPSAIMGDAITAVSAGWTPSETGNQLNTGNPATSRIATDTTYPIIPYSGASSPDVVPLSQYTDSTTRPAGMTVNAAILTGNTPSYIDPANPAAGQNGSLSYNSGGAQNLVRMEEDWYDVPGGLTLTLQGSLGQLFSSDYFRGPYRGNSNVASIGDTIYSQPLNRVVNYDTNLGVRTPFGTPTTTSFTIGPFFFW